MYLIGCIVLSILLVGFFIGIQVAFVNLNRLSVELKKKQGKSSGILFSGFLEEPSRFIGITLVGFNIFLVVYGLLNRCFAATVLELVGYYMAYIKRLYQRNKVFI